MSIIKVWAAGVGNLSDARYFAAMGVERMSFQLRDQSDIAKILEIREWVAGPAIGIEVVEDHYSELLFEAISRINPDFVLLPHSWKDTSASIDALTIQTGIFPEIDNNLVWKVDESNLENAIGLSSKDDVYLDGPFQVEHIQLLTEQVDPKGIILRGGDEIAVGIKSFDELDVLFEALGEE